MLQIKTLLEVGTGQTPQPQASLHGYSGVTLVMGRAEIGYSLWPIRLRLRKRQLGMQDKGLPHRQRIGLRAEEILEKVLQIHRLQISMLKPQ